MKNLTFILPIHVYNEELIRNVLTNLSQFTDTTTMIVAPKDVADAIRENYSTFTPTFVVNDGATDYCSQVNLGVKECTTEYFSVIEFDDEYYDKWLSNFEIYSKDIDAAAYLPIVEMVDTNRNTVALGNELAWSTSFVEDLGYLDLECLKSFYDFNIVGGIIKRDVFLEIGGLKPSMDIAATYEFLMRMVNNGHKVYVVPKIGYKHMVGREDSFIMQSKTRITQEYGEWIIKTAQVEMEYKEERDVHFSEE